MKVKYGCESSLHKAPSIVMSVTQENLQPHFDVESSVTVLNQFDRYICILPPSFSHEIVLYGAGKQCNSELLYPKLHRQRDSWNENQRRMGHPPLTDKDLPILLILVTALAITQCRNENRPPISNFLAEGVDTYECCLGRNLPTASEHTACGRESICSVCVGTQDYRCKAQSINLQNNEKEMASSKNSVPSSDKSL